jgi:hypothetical protein
MSCALDAPLLTGTDLRDISTHAGFDDGGRPGTFGIMTAANRIGYLLLSPALFAKAAGGGIWRLGAWGGVHGTPWPHYDTVTKPSDARPTTPPCTRIWRWGR